MDTEWGLSPCGHYWGYYPDTLPWRQISATHLTIYPRMPDIQMGPNDLTENRHI